MSTLNQIIIIVALCCIARIESIPPDAQLIKPYFFHQNDTNVKEESRIVGGSNATLFTAPYQASIRVRAADIPFGRGHICGGSLINDHTIATAAHCFYYESYNSAVYMWSASDLSVVMGSILLARTSSTFESLVRSYVVHKSFSLSTLVNDVAVIILASPVPENHPYIHPIQLANYTLPDNTSCQISGFGTTYSDGVVSPQLLYANISLLSYSKCYQMYEGSLSTGMMCAGVWDGSRDACQGDSGGPLECNGSLYGIVSWGYKCGIANYPGIYTNVPYFQTWIRTNSSYKFVANLVLIFTMTVFMKWWIV